MSPADTRAAMRLAYELGVRDTAEEEGADYEMSEGEYLMEAQRRIDASWSEPFLRSTLAIVRNSRRKLMSSLKSLELRTREHAVEEVSDFVEDIANVDRARAVVSRASKTGLV